MYKVFIRLPLRVPIVELVLITESKLFGILRLDLLIGHSLTLTLWEREGETERGAGEERERERKGEREKTVSNIPSISNSHSLTTSNSLRAFHCSTLPSKNWAV